MYCGLNQKEIELLSNIINKAENWNSDYDQLFIELIPFSISIIRSNTYWAKNILLNEHDFLTEAFLAFSKVINHYINEPSLLKQNFLLLFGRELRNRCRNYGRFFNKNGQKILNNYVDFENVNEPEQSPVYCNTSYYFALLKTLKNNFILQRVLDLLFKGMSIEDISDKLNLKPSYVYRCLQNCRKKIAQYV